MYSFSNKFNGSFWFPLADMNSRRIKAGREMTGESGILSEVSGDSVVFAVPRIYSYFTL